MLDSVRMLWLTAIFLCKIYASVGEIADIGTVPKGVNPTLYDSVEDSVIQLDETTFNDTVFCTGREDCSSYLVEVSCTVETSFGLKQNLIESGSG